MCNETCPRYTSLKKLPIQVITQETYHETLKPPTPSTSRKRRCSHSHASSISSASTGKHSREESVSKELEKLRVNEERRKEILNKIKIYCLLDPSRAEESYENVANSHC